MCDFVIVVAAIAVVAATAAVWLPSSMVVVVVVIHKTIHHFDLITYTCIYFVLYVLSSRVLICSFFAPPYVCVFVHASCAHKHIRTVLCHVYVALVRTRIPIFFLFTNWIFRWSKHFIPNCAKKAECWCFVKECFFSLPLRNEADGIPLKINFNWNRSLRRCIAHLACEKEREWDEYRAYAEGEWKHSYTSFKTQSQICRAICKLSNWISVAFSIAIAVFFSSLCV